MIIVDVNVLIYAYDARAPQHAQARKWVEDAFSGLEPVRIPWAVAHGFLRLTTRGPIMSRPFTIEAAANIIDDWFESPNVAPIEPGDRYWPILRHLLFTTDVRGALVSDAHLAALAIEHGAAICTTDRDFRRFDGLRLINPVA